MKLGSKLKYFKILILTLYQTNIFKRYFRKPQIWFHLIRLEFHINLWLFTQVFPWNCINKKNQTSPFNMSCPLSYICVNWPNKDKVWVIFYFWSFENKQQTKNVRKKPISLIYFHNIQFQEQSYDRAFSPARINLYNFHLSNSSEMTICRFIPTLLLKTLVSYSNIVKASEETPSKTTM